MKAFRSLPEAGALAAANKRVQNILRKSGTAETIDIALLELPEERNLHHSLTAVDDLVTAKYKARDYAGALCDLANIRSQVDAFFEKVLVNAEDAAVRRNRLALLTRLGKVMNQVADIARLSA